MSHMTDEEVDLFELGWAAYVDGFKHDEVPAYPNIEHRRWWLKGWYASRQANEMLRGNA